MPESDDIRQCLAVKLLEYLEFDSGVICGLGPIKGGESKESWPEYSADAAHFVLGCYGNTKTPACILFLAYFD